MSPTEPRPTTQELLEGYQLEALRAMAAALDLGGAASIKSEVVALLLGHYRVVDPDWLAETVSSLSPGAAALLGWLQRAGGSASRDVIETMLVRHGALDQAGPRRPARPAAAADRTRRGGRSDSQAFEDLAVRLELAGLVLGHRVPRTLRMLELGVADHFFVPAEIRSTLPDSAVSIGAKTPLVAREVPGEAAVLSRDLYLLFGHVWRRQPALTRHLRLTKRALKAVLPEIRCATDLKAVTREEDIARLWFLRSMLGQLGLVRPARTRTFDVVLAADAVAARTWWSKSLADRTRDCLEAWLRARWWNELVGLTGVIWRPEHGDTSESTPSAVVSARRIVLGVLARVAARDGWTSLTAATDELFLTQRDFLVPEENPPHYVPVHGPSRYSPYRNRSRWAFQTLASTSVGWDDVEVGFVKAIVEGLGWLGLLDRGLDADEALVAYRFTAIGRQLLGGRGSPPEEATSGGRVVVQPNFRVLAMGPVPELDLLELEMFAERRSVDVALEFELTRESVYRAQLAGLDADAILDRLRTLASAEPPQNVTRTIVEWQARHERVAVHLGARLLQAADPAALDEALKSWSKVAGASGPARLSPTVARMPAGPDAGRALDSCLRTLGTTARQADGTSPTHCVVLQADGEARPVQPCPTLQVLGWLQRLTERDEATGTFRLTRTAVRMALREWGLDADAQVRLWTQLLRPPVPDGLALRIKTWSGHYGQARLTTPILLEFADDATLADLQQQPGLIGRLTSLPARGIAVVAPEELEAVRAALTDLGVEVAEGPGAPDPSDAPPAAHPRRSRGTSGTRSGSSRRP